MELGCRSLPYTQVINSCLLWYTSANFSIKVLIVHSFNLSKGNSEANRIGVGLLLVCFHTTFALISGTWHQWELLICLKLQEIQLFGITTRKLRRGLGSGNNKEYGGGLGKTFSEGSQVPIRLAVAVNEMCIISCSCYMRSITLSCVWHKHDTFYWNANISYCYSCV